MSKRLLIAAGALVICIAGVVLLFDRRSPPPPEVDPVPSFPITLVDDEGVTSTVAAGPRTIISFAPQFTETLFAMGVGDRIIGVSAGETDPPEATALPEIVGDDGLTPDTARVVELAPGLVLTSGMPQAPWKTQLRNAGLTVVTLNATSFDDALADLLKVGRLAGKSRQATTLIARLRTSARKLSIPKERPSVFLETFYPPLTGAGSSGFVPDMVRLAGGQLIARTPAETEAWSIEDLQRANPALYLAFRSTAGSKEEIAGRPGFDKLAAVSGGRILIVNDDIFLRPGPRMVQGLKALNQALNIP